MSNTTPATSIASKVNAQVSAIRARQRLQALVKRLAGVTQNRQKRLAGNRLSKLRFVVVTSLEKGTYDAHAHCLLSTGAPIIETLAGVENNSAIPGVIVVEEPGTAPQQALSACPSSIIPDRQAPTRRRKKESAVEPKQLKALELAARANIRFVNGFWLVPSQTSPTVTYHVTIDPPGCECDDFALTRQPCKHVLAAQLVNEKNGGAKAPPLDTDKVPKKPTYSQDWPKYHRAQREEHDRFLSLLDDLVSGIVEPDHPGNGRKPVMLRDQLFACCYKVWSTLSTMRFDGLLRRAIADGYILRPTLHPNKVSCFMQDPALMPYFKAMVTRSALPLASIETEFAVDASGFTSSKFVPWRIHKYGKQVDILAHDWIKVHIAAGVNTHVVTAAAVYERDTNDCPIMPELIRKTRENFRVDECSADKAYLSVDNVEAVFGAGGIPFIAPKMNTTGAAGGKFEEMYHYYLYRREEFLRHYHKRSNVESVFSAVGRKFSGHVRSKKQASGANEVYCKLICHNIWCVILSTIELGIEAEFWRDGPEQLDDGPAILAFRCPV